MTIEALRAALADRYRIERELGQGGMATVYLAEDLKHGRKVAIKVLRPDLAASIGAGRFLREIQIAAQLQHPHILGLIDSGVATDGQRSTVDRRPSTVDFLYYVMPYIEGQSLRERLDREGELPVHEGVRLISQVVDALAEAHRLGVVHRDIKPDNVMLAGRHALVADFGVAKAISEATGHSTVTTLGVAVGTPAYMSPEQAAADPHVDHRSDIYSAGVMAYEMLTGQPPFTGSTPQQVLAAHVTQEPVAITRRRPAIPAALEAVIMRCLAKRAADRWQTADELHAALEPFGTPSAGVTPTQTVPVRTGPVHSRGRLAAAGVAVLMLAGLAWWALAPRNSAAHAIAVLPFANASRDTADDYLADGIANDVRDGLMHLPGLIVKARTSSAAARGKSVHEAGQLLRVPVLLQGEFRRTGGRVAVTVDLVKVSDESAVWSHDFALPADGNFSAAQDSITSAVAAALHITQARGAQGAAAQRGTSNQQAYDLYLRGMFFFAKRGIRNLTQAIDYFRQAIALDPDFAHAYAGISLVEGVLPSYVETSTDSVLRDAEGMARKALALDSTLPDAHLALANALSGAMRSGDAEAEFQKAITLDPRNATARQWHGDNLVVLGRTDDAVREGTAATDLDPLSPVAFNDLAYMLLCAGRYSESIAAAYRALELDPRMTPVFQFSATAQLFTGQSDSAAAGFRRFLADYPLHPLSRGWTTWLYAIEGRWPDAERTAEAIRQRPAGSVRNVNLVMAELALGNKGAALDALEEGIRNRSFYLATTSLGCDPGFSLLRDEPRYAAIVKEAGQGMCTNPVTWPAALRR
jgi:serine/threonine-protein kinase